MKYLRLNHSYTAPLQSGVYFFFAVLLAALLSGCTQPSGSGNPASTSQQTRTTAYVPPADVGLLLLLVPDGQVLTDPMVTAWIDAGSEIGVRIQAVTNQQFRALGDTALRYAGLILPDRLHVVADEVLLKSISNYTQAGGQTLLVYDFGTMALNSNRQPTYPIPKSRLSDLAGVEYALYDSLREKSLAIGTIAAMRSTLRELQVPPGKSSLYELPDNLASGIVAPVIRSTSWIKGVETPGVYVAQSSAAPSGNKVAGSVTVAADVLESYSGYLLGNLTYPSFVTRGAYSGVVLATSAEAGLVAGLNKAGFSKRDYREFDLSAIEQEQKPTPTPAQEELNLTAQTGEEKPAETGDGQDLEIEKSKLNPDWEQQAVEQAVIAPNGDQPASTGSGT